METKFILAGDARVQTVQRLGKLRREVNSILEDWGKGSSKPAGLEEEAVNWGDLNCFQAAHIIDDEGVEYDEVSIEEADERAARFQHELKKELQNRGYGKVVVRTEW